MTIHGFLAVPGVEGDATLVGHEGSIAIHGISWQIAVAEPNTSSSRSRVGPDSSLFHVTKLYDRSSPKLAAAVGDRRKFDDVVYTAIRSDDDGTIVDYMAITLSNVRVDSYLVGSRDGQFVENIRFRAVKLDISYSQFDGDGKAVYTEDVEISLR